MAKLYLKKLATLTTITACLITLTATPAVAQKIPVYRGPIVFPQFNGRDKAYSIYRTRIMNEMRTGPNFAGRYAILQFGCGTGCTFVFSSDVSTGRIYDFPYGGEEFQMMDLKFDVKSRDVDVIWTSDGVCMRDTLRWNGMKFISINKMAVSRPSGCYF